MTSSLKQKIEVWGWGEGEDRGSQTQEKPKKTTNSHNGGTPRNMSIYPYAFSLSLCPTPTPAALKARIPKKERKKGKERKGKKREKKKGPFFQSDLFFVKKNFKVKRRGGGLAWPQRSGPHRFASLIFDFFLKKTEAFFSPSKLVHIYAWVH